MEGWVKIHRKILYHWIWQDPEKLRAWLDLIMMANHEPRTLPIDTQLVTIDEGQRWTSIEGLAARWQWDRKRVRRFLDMLKSDGMIYYQTTNRGTLITIVNYKDYQQKSNGNGTAKGTADGQQKGQPENIRRDTNKNELRMSKNGKKNKGDVWQ